MKDPLGANLRESLYLFLLPTFSGPNLIQVVRNSSPFAGKANTFCVVFVSNIGDKFNKGHAM